MSSLWGSLPGRGGDVVEGPPTGGSGGSDQRTSNRLHGGEVASATQSRAARDGD
jgi:hypothetical protein